MKKIKAGKAPVCIPIELLQHGGKHVANALHTLIKKSWLGSPVPQDWINGLLVSIFKSKGTKSDCDHHHGITLLESAGKVLARVLLDRLIENICPLIIPEAQYSFTEGRGCKAAAGKMYWTIDDTLTSICGPYKGVWHRKQRGLVGNSWEDWMSSYFCQDVSRTPQKHEGSCCI